MRSKYSYIVILLYFLSLLGSSAYSQGPIVFPGDGAGHGPDLIFLKKGDGTFIDMNTKFIWEMKDDSGGLHDIDNQYSWSLTGSTEPNGTLFTDFLEKINNRCDGDESKICAKDSDCIGIGKGKCGLAGYRDWCIPNIKQLQSLVNYSKLDPATSLPDVQKSKFFWSSTEFADDPNDAWVVKTRVGIVGDVLKTTTLGMSARAVRPCETTEWSGIKFEFMFGSLGGGQGTFRVPTDILLNLDNSIYVSDPPNNMIQIFKYDGEFDRDIREYENFGINQIQRPRGLALDSVGNIYIAEWFGHKIIKCDQSDQCTVFAGSGFPGYKEGMGQNAQFKFPMGLTMDNQNNLYIADSSNHVIRICTKDAECRLLAGFPGRYGNVNGSAERGSLFNGPSSLAIAPSNTLLVADTHNHSIRQYDPINKSVSTILGSGGQGYSQGSGLQATFSFPRGVAADKEGRIFVADTGNNRIVIYQPNGTYIDEFGILGNGEGQFNNPIGINVDDSRVYVVDSGNSRIQVFLKKRD